MLQSYLKTALRLLYRQKIYSAINIFSLSLGIACCILIFLYVRNEFTFDRFHENAENIYRVYRVEQRTNGTTKVSEGTPVPLAPALRADVPAIEQAVRLTASQALVRYGDQAFTEILSFSDPGFFEMFSFPLRQGTAQGLLADPNTVVLSTVMAEKYFGADDPLGARLTLELGDTPRDVIVAGVAEPFPSNSSITFDFLLPLAQWPGYQRRIDAWGSYSNATYIQVADEADVGRLEAQLARLVPQYFGAIIEGAQAQGWWVERDDAFALGLQPLTDVHLNTEVDTFFVPRSDPANSYILMGIALMVLLLACVNFMTLAAGRASSRAREVGVRKTLGAHRAQLIKQFWGEAVLLSFLALFLGLMMAEMLLPVFNALASTRLVLSYTDHVSTLLGLAMLAVLCGVVAGSYPALILSSFRPANVLKGDIARSKGLWFTRGLVVFQFTVSIAMLACTLVMYDQIEYVKTKNLGFAEEEVVVVTLGAGTTDVETTMHRFREQITGYSGVRTIAATSFALGGNWSRTVIQQGGQQHLVYTARIDPQYLETMDLTLTAGRNFSADLETDIEGAVLVNETLVRAMGWTDPIGQPLPGYDEVTVVGVVADYHFRSLHYAIEPTFLHMSPDLADWRYAMVRIHTDRVSETLDFLEQSWQAIAPDYPFRYQFLDQQLDQQYEAEERWSQIVQYATGFAILIACLGLFGLATLSVSRRTKEVGIRKALGASAPSIALLLSKSFARLVVLAFVLATPLTYFAMNRWLDSFAYHTTIGPDTLLLAGTLTLAVALLTVSYQALKAAATDPVDCLRYE